MLWLFEIARRSVVSVKNPTDEKKQLDNLPIGSAIARLVKLLELGNEKICSFDDVFHPKGKFHCFKGNAMERRKAIDEINKTTLERRKEIDGINEKTHFQELSEMFLSEKRQVERVAEELERNLNIWRLVSAFWWTKSSFNTEAYEASDLLTTSFWFMHVLLTRCNNSQSCGVA